MQAAETGAKERLVAAAKEEFLAHGFKNASLRKICAKAGVTTGALYFFFRSKEDLFCSIVERTLSLYEELIRSILQSDWEDPATALQNEERLIRFLMAHKEEYRLILEKSAGTKYEGFYAQYQARMEAICSSYFEKNAPGNGNPELVKLLVSMRLQGYLELMKEAITVEEAIQLAKYMACYADAGLAALIKVLNSGKN